MVFKGKFRKNTSLRGDSMNKRTWNLVDYLTIHMEADSFYFCQKSLKKLLTSVFGHPFEAPKFTPKIDIKKNESISKPFSCSRRVFIHQWLQLKNIFRVNRKYKQKFPWFPLIIRTIHIKSSYISTPTLENQRRFLCWTVFKSPQRSFMSIIELIST